jgi:uncharacterized protein YodC (DUF2158 family)
MTHNFKTGDIVKLKSGSPDMTIIEISDDFVYCTWYDYRTNTWHENRSFPAIALCKA